MAKDNNLKDLLTDVADAIREKKGTAEKINPQDFSEEIKSIKTSSSIWTGHVDVEGLKAIGWDDEDIAYYQEHGVNWNEEDDQYHLVSDDNKALYGVINKSNLSQYKNVVVWLPKIEDEFVTSMDGLFNGFSKMEGMPKLKTRNVRSVNSLYYNCHRLTCTHPINYVDVENAANCYRNCYSLKKPYPLPTSIVNQGVSYAFSGCWGMVEYTEDLDFTKTSSCDAVFYQNYSLERVGEINVMGKVLTSIFSYCYNLKDAKVRNLCSNISLSADGNISKASLLYMINNEAATSAITITLHASAYARLSTDADILEALENHPLVTLASA